MAHPAQHFELKMNNTDQSMSFYENVFAWTIDASGTNGHWVILDGQPSLIGEFSQAPSSTDAALLMFFGVPNLQNTLDTVELEGGEVVGIGFSTPVFQHNFAIVRDIENCLFGIYQI